MDEVTILRNAEVALTEEMFLNFLAAVMFLCLVVFVHACGIREGPSKPTLEYNQESLFINRILERTQTLKKAYIPTLIWGKNGHFQTLFHAFFGRIGRIPMVESSRVRITAEDGSLVTYDVFEPQNKSQRGNRDIVLVVPGISNHSETTYVRAFSCFLTNLGFTVAVFNHTGALKGEELKRPRIFSFGHTDDLALTVNHLLKTSGAHKLIGIGFSMGGNILLKYLGEKKEMQRNFYFCASICQGYDAYMASQMFYDWESLRRVYNYAMANNMKKSILNHKNSLIKMGLNVDWERVEASTSLQELDHCFTKISLNLKDVNEFYKWSSSKNYMNNITIPTLIVNALDDPIVPDVLFEAPRSLLKHNKDALFVTLRHGGHLGFFEGGYIIPERVSWMDRMLGEFIISGLDAIGTENKETK